MRWSVRGVCENILREVDVEEVEVECRLHETGGDSDGVDHILREVSGGAVSARCVWVGGGQDPGHRDT